MNADAFQKKLKALASAATAKSHHHLAADATDIILGVSMGQVFALAKEFMQLPPDEIEKMLASLLHEMRVGAVSIMDFQAPVKKQQRRAAKSCSICTSGVMSASTVGIW